MEGLFENTCAFSRENIAEMVESHGKRITFRAVSGFLIVCAAVVLLAFAVKGVGLWCLVLLPLLAAVWGYRLFARPRKAAETAYDRYFGYFHREVETHVVFFDDHLSADDLATGRPMDLHYGHIVDVRETKSLLLLSLPKDVTILLDKSRFQGGTTEEFLKFLRPKCGGAVFRLRKSAGAAG